MNEQPSRLVMYEDLLRRTASGVRNAQLYATDHPLVARNMAGLITVLSALHQQQPSITVGIVGSDLVIADTPMHKISATMTELIKKLQDNKVERIAFERGVTQDELVTLVHNLSRLGGKAAGDADKDLSTPHIRVGRLKSGDDKKQDGIASDIAAIRQMYSSAVASAEALVASAETEGMPDAPAALQTVEGLADAVTQNRTALMALTAMRNYDNYTFTHMVNVSILTMAQARALGIDGKLLREFGLSALMHDIGKVRTPKEILNKPGKLTDEEFVIMRRHTVDGAEILRRTPEMPALAPVVAFEHHLRADGTGYPGGVVRTQLNLATMLCGIADVVHQRGEAEFPEQRSFDAQAARLTHRQDRDVHHVRECVVVVVLQRGEREERGAVLRDRLRERVDHAARGIRVRLAFGVGALPQPAGHRHCVVIQPPERGNVAERRIDALLHLQAPDPDVRQLRQRRRDVAGGVRASDGLHQLTELRQLDAAVDDDALDAGVLQPAHQLAHGFGGAGHRGIADYQLVADDSDGERLHPGMRERQRVGERLDVAEDERVSRRVELGAAKRRGQPPDNLLGNLGAMDRVHERSLTRRAAISALGRAILRTLRLPVLTASASTATVSGDPMRSSAVAAASRSAAVLNGASQSVWCRTRRSVRVDSAWALRLPSASMISACALASRPRGRVWLRT